MFFIMLNSIMGKTQKQIQFFKMASNQIFKIKFTSNI